MARDEAALIVAGRVLERIAIVGAGALCVWLGYRLFQLVPTADSTGEFHWGNNTLTLTKVGPGVFFALFGVFLLWRSLSAAVRVPIGAAPGHGAPAMAIFATGEADAAAHEQKAVHARNDIAILNALAAHGPPGLDPADVERTAHQARVAMLARVWHPAWGDDAAFRRLEAGEVPAEGPVHDLYFAEPNAASARR